MMLFAKSDEDLAYILSKEMAHNELGHTKTLQNTHAATSLIDNLTLTPPRQATSTGLKPMPKKFDIDADTLSLAMSLRGGYGIDNATRFWKRLAYRFPATNAMNYTALHPATSARLEAMPNAITRIKAIDKRRKSAGHAEVISRDTTQITGKSVFRSGYSVLYRKTMTQGTRN